MKKLISLLLLFPLSTAADVYKWTDELGQVNYSDNALGHEDAERVEIREQRTGLLISDAGRSFLLQAERENEYSNLISQINRLPATSAGTKRLSEEACQSAKNILEEKELQLNRLLDRGYKQFERISAENAVESWELKVSRRCG